MVDPNVDESREAEFFLHAESERQLPEVVSFRTDSKDLRVEAGPGMLVPEPDGTYARRLPLKLRLRTNNQTPGPGQAAIYARVGADRKTDEIRASVTWTVRNTYSVLPPQVYFGVVDITKKGHHEKRVIIRRTDKAAFSIKAVESTCRHVRCSLKRPEPFSCQLLVLLDPSGMTNAIWGEVVIETDHKLCPYLRIPVAAVVKGGN
jgi:hypothetical protein